MVLALVAKFEVCFDIVHRARSVGCCMVYTRVRCSTIGNRHMDITFARDTRVQEHMYDILLTIRLVFDLALSDSTYKTLWLTSSYDASFHPIPSCSFLYSNVHNAVPSYFGPSLSKKIDTRRKGIGVG